MIRRFFVHRLALGALELSATVTLQAQGRAKRDAGTPATRLDAYAAQALAAWGLPGAAVAVVHNDSVVFAKGF